MAWVMLILVSAAETIIDCCGWQMLGTLYLQVSLWESNLCEQFGGEACDGLYNSICEELTICLDRCHRIQG